MTALRPISTDGPPRRADPRPKWWTATVEEVIAAFDTDTGSGLSSADADNRIARDGPNELPDPDRHSPWRLFASQFANTMVAVLGVAVVITVFLGDHKDTIVIAAILVLNAVVGFLQEYRAEQAMAALRTLADHDATVVRDGTTRQVPARLLARGDVVLLSTGNVVPADVRLVEVGALRVDEASLTGESAPVEKQTTSVDADAGSNVGDRADMAFKGTSVTHGRGRGIVVATGTDTEIGRIAALMGTAAPPSTLLGRRLNAAGKRIALAALAACIAVFTIGLVRGEPFEVMFLTAVSLAVAAIPEGLPAVVTVALALGARRMAERRALVRRLSAVETLGSVSVICADKTGTLTQNRMVVERVWTPAGEFELDGDGYAPSGHVRPSPPPGDTTLDSLAAVAAACNDATLQPNEDGRSWSLHGDPTEGALLAMAAKLAKDATPLHRPRPRLTELAFDSSRKRMTTAHIDGDGQWIATKGALEAVAPLLGEGQASSVADADEVTRRWAGEGYRVLALADRHVSGLPVGDDIEHDLRLVGLVAIADPPRAESRSAIAECRHAGIQPVMITGDHPLTATTIAQRLGLHRSDRAAVTGRELATMTDDELADRVADIEVYARVSPEQKLRIVEAWQRRGAVVAMTGDGVNDAPALTQADAGVAMGGIGTDVSREAADLVLADDNFATIVAAVEEGRRIYDNIRRFVRYLLTTNTGEVLVMFLAPVFGLPLPLLPVQILWINLVTDGMPAIALGLEPAERGAMRRPPRSPSESLFARGLWQHIIWVGCLMALTVVPLQVVARHLGWEWQTMVFTTLALLQLGHALAVRSESESLRELGVRTNPWLLRTVLITVAVQLLIVYVPALQRVFDTHSLSAIELGVTAAAGTTTFIAVEIEKRIRRRQPSSRAIRDSG